MSWPRWPLATLDAGWDAEAGRFDAERLLWREPRAYAAPQQNGAAALARVHEALLRKRPLGGAEQDFLDRHAALSRDPARLQAWWSLPRSVFWTHVAEDLLSACLEGSEPAASTADYCAAIAEHVPARALARHLTAFAAGEWDVAGAGSAVARHGDFALPIDASALAVPGYRHAEPAVAAGSDYQARHAPLVAATLASIDRYVPELFAELRRAIRVIALKPLDAGGYDDFSNPELPGSFIASVVHDPLELADHFIHELQHNRLSFIEEAGPLFAAPACDPSVARGCYSPWRDQPRSLYGVFHGVYVFLAVYRYWRRVHDAADLPAEARAYAVDRLLRLPRQLALAVAMLERYARLTPLGSTLLAQLARDVAAVRADVRTARLPADAPALRATEEGGYAPERDADGRPLRVLEALRLHVARHAAGSQCAGLEDVLAG